MSNLRIMQYKRHRCLSTAVKFLLIAMLLFFLDAKAQAQDAPAESLKELVLRLRESKADTNRISLELKLGSYYLYKPGEYKDDLDSTIYYFNQALELSNKLDEKDWQYRTLALIGNYYVEASDLARCNAYFMRVIAYEHQKNDLVKEADTWYWLADLYYNNMKNDHLQERINYYQRARSLYLQIHQPLKAADALKEIAGLHTVSKQFDLAERELQQVLDEYSAIHYKKQQNVYDLLNGLEFSRGNYYRSMTYCLAGIRSMKANGDTTLAPNFYYGMGKANYAVKNYKEALKWIRRATIADRKSNSLVYNYFLIQILIKLNRTSEALTELNGLRKRKKVFDFLDTRNNYRMLALYYDKINKPALAIQYYKEVLKMDLKGHLGEENYNSFFIILNNSIAGIYLKISQPNEAKKYLDSAARTIKTTKTVLPVPSLAEFYQLSYKYNLAVGNYRASLINLQQYDRIQDSLFTVDKENRVAELNIQYQSVQKEQAIKFLHNQSAVQQTKLEKADLERNITIGGIILISLFTGLFYQQYRAKQKANNLIAQKNNLLVRLVGEKELLLKEVHHRVKNNLHIVMSLLESQSAHLNNKAAITAILESQNRVRAIALIHQKLYGSANVVQVEMKDYIPELIKYLEESFNIPERKILIKYDVGPIGLDVSQAIPVGIILNEAITNAIKYAFDGQKGEIQIVMKQYDGKKIVLSIADNGKGLPTNINASNFASLGMTLIKGLIAQLEGTLKVESHGGVKISIDFPKDESMNFNRFEMVED